MINSSSSSSPTCSLVVVHSRSCPHCVRFLAELDASLENRLLREVPGLVRIERLEMESPDAQRRIKALSLPPFKTVPAVFVRGDVLAGPIADSEQTRTFASLRAAILSATARAAVSGGGPAARKAPTAFGLRSTTGTVSRRSLSGTYSSTSLRRKTCSRTAEPARGEKKKKKKKKKKADSFP